MRKTKSPLKSSTCSFSASFRTTENTLFGVVCRSIFRIFPHSSARFPHAESRSTPDGQALFVVQCRTTKHLRVLVDLQKFGVRVVPADAVTNQTCELPQAGEQHFTAPPQSPQHGKAKWRERGWQSGKVRG